MSKLQQDSQIVVRVTTQLRSALERCAAADGIELSEIIRRVLVLHVLEVAVSRGDGGGIIDTLRQDASAQSAAAAA